MEDVPSPPPASTIAEQPDDGAIDSDPEEFAQANPNSQDAPTNSGLDSGDDPWLAAGPSAFPIAEDPADGTMYMVPEKFAQANPNLLGAPTSSGGNSWEDFDESYQLVAGPSTYLIAEDLADGTMYMVQEEFAQANPNLLDAPTSFGGDSGDDFNESYQMVAGPSANIQGLDAYNLVATSGEALSPRPIKNEELMVLALHAARKGKPMNCMDWVFTNMKHVIPASLNKFVHPKKGTLKPVDLYKYLNEKKILLGLSTKQQVLHLLNFMEENKNAINNYMLFCVGIGLNYDKVNYWVTSTGCKGPGWQAQRQKLKVEPDPGDERLADKLKTAGRILKSGLRYTVPQAATWPTTEKLASPGGRSIEHGGHQISIPVEKCMEFAKVVAVYGENRSIKTWVKNQLPNFTRNSYNGFIGSDGTIDIEKLKSHISSENKNFKPATARDIIDLSNFIQEMGGGIDRPLLLCGLSLAEWSQEYIKSDGTLTKSGIHFTARLRKDTENLGHVTQELIDLQNLFQDTRVTWLDAQARSIPTQKRTSEHLSHNERSAKAPRMENLPSFVLEAGPSADIQGLEADNPVATSGETLSPRPITNEAHNERSAKAPRMENLPSFVLEAWPSADIQGL